MGRRKRDDAAGSSDQTRLSKKMTTVLRHRIHENGLGAVLRPDGFVPLAALLRAPGFGSVTVEQVRQCVADNDKQRLTLRDEAGELFIRANQGHTVDGISDEALLEPLDEASGGLSPMARKHVHLAADLPGASGVVSGMRASAQVHVWVDVRGAVRAGVPFYRSSNGVLLTPGVGGLLPLAHFERVVDAASGREWRDGDWAAAAAGGSAEAAPAVAPVGGELGEG